MDATACSATSYGRTRQYSIGSLLQAIFSVGLRHLPNIIRGRGTVVERETARQTLLFLVGTIPSSAATAFVYGLGATYFAYEFKATPVAFQTFVLPALGELFLNIVIPFAIANLVVLKGVVGMTSDIASMRISQEVDALEAVGLHPAQIIFAPRAIALIVTAPALAILAIYAAGCGAWVVAWAVAGTPLLEFGEFFVASIPPGAVLLVVVKLAITAIAMSVISGHFGFVESTTGQGFVGRITTTAVATAVLATTIVSLFLSLISEVIEML